MSIVDKFLLSLDPGWEISEQDFVDAINREESQDIVLVARVNPTRFCVLNRKYLRVKVIDPNSNGNDSEVDNERKRTMGG